VYPKVKPEPEAADSTVSFFGREPEPEAVNRQLLRQLARLLSFAESACGRYAEPEAMNHQLHAKPWSWSWSLFGCTALLVSNREEIGLYQL
jgi:hypothetical protein